MATCDNGTQKGSDLFSSPPGELVVNLFIWRLEIVLNDTITNLALTEDYSVLHAADELITHILQTNPFSLEDLSNALQENTTIKDSVNEVMDMATKSPTDTLSDQASIKFARQLLVHLALTNQNSASYVNHALSTWRDDRQSVSKVFAYGVAASMVVMVATTEISYKEGEIQIEKKAIDAEQIQAIADLVNAITKEGNSTLPDKSNKK